LRSDFAECIIDFEPRRMPTGRLLGAHSARQIEPQTNHNRSQCPRANNNMQSLGDCSGCLPGTLRTSVILCSHWLVLLMIFLDVRLSMCIRFVFLAPSGTFQCSFFVVFFHCFISRLMSSSAVFVSSLWWRSRRDSGSDMEC